MTKPAKDTVYIEADDEITAVIDKVTSAKNKVVAVVLPKRAPVFQSVVNMKLLKKSAEGTKKSLVIITSEDAIRSIAAVASVHVAKTLNSKPEIPKKPKVSKEITTIAAHELDPKKDKDVPSEPKDDEPEKTKKKDDPEEEDVIDIDNSDSDDEAKEGKKAIGGVRATKKALKIPDFGNFRVKLGVGALLLALIATGWVYGFIIAPKATVTINTDTSKTSVSYQFTVRNDTSELDPEQRVVPASLFEVTKEDTVKVAATGEKNVGAKADGSITITNCGIATYSVSEGDQFTSGGFTFIADESVNVPKSGYSFSLNGFECDEDGKKAVQVVASVPGDDSNLPAGAYGISGTPSNVSAVGTAMTGGTDDIKTIVSADDIKNATAQLKGSSSAEAKTELETKFEAEGLTSLEDTFEEAAPTVKNSATEGTEVPEVSVTQTVVYSMLGVTADHLGSLLDAELAKQLQADDNTKDVRNNGYETAVLRLVSKTSATQQVLELQTVATLGDKFDTEAIRNEVAGMTRGEIKNLIESRERVRSVDVTYSPGWITTTPKSAKKITVIVNEVENE